MGQCKAVADLTLGEVWRGDVRGGFDAATSRILAYWTDECARDLGKLMTHFNVADDDEPGKANAFRNPKQTVLTCRKEGRIIGFLVLEKPAPDKRFWSLIGLAPEMTGQGLGRRTWHSLLAFHAAEGVTEISTSISSHNLAVFNLYVSLGFRFPPPEITLHWCPAGPLAPPHA